MQKKLNMFFLSISSCWRRAPPCHFLYRLIQYVYTYRVSPSAWHNSQPPTSQHQTHSHSRHQTPSHVGSSIRFKHAANTDWHMCARSRARLIVPHKLSEVCMWSSTWVFITSVLIRATPRTLWDVTALQNKQAYRHGWYVISNICIITDIKKTNKTKQGAIKL